MPDTLGSLGTIGFIGLGNMGAPMALRLIGQGFPLVVHDREAAAMARIVAEGAAVLPDPAAVADAADTVLVCLPTPDVVQQVALGPHGLIEGRRVRHVVDLSTTGPQVTRTVAAALAAKAITLVDAPVTGGIAKAASGDLTMILGGPADALARLRPLLAGLASRLVTAGPQAGDGQMLKILNNLLSFVALEATAEAMTLGVRCGLAPDAMLEVFNHGSGRNSATEDKFPRDVLTRRFNFGFPIHGVHKDLSLCLAEAQALGVPMPVSNSVLQVWALAMAERGEEDMTAIVKLFERWAGVEIQGRQDQGSAL